MIRFFGLYLMTRREYAEQAGTIGIQKELIRQLEIANAWNHAALEEKRNHSSGIMAEARADFLYRKELT